VLADLLQIFLLFFVVVHDALDEHVRIALHDGERHADLVGEKTAEFFHARPCFGAGGRDLALGFELLLLLCGARVRGVLPGGEQLAAQDNGAADKRRKSAEHEQERVDRFSVIQKAQSASDCTESKDGPEQDGLRSGFHGRSSSKKSGSRPFPG